MNYYAEQITRSKQLLRSGSSVSEVCASVGFDSTTSFAGLFKKREIGTIWRIGDRFLIFVPARDIRVSSN